MEKKKKEEISDKLKVYNINNKEKIINNKYK
jgi:hypothetical protein